MHPPLSYNNNYLVAGVCGVSLRGVSLGRKSRQMESNVVDTCCRNRADLVSSLKATLILCCRQSPKIHSHIWVQRSLAILQKVHGEFFSSKRSCQIFLLSPIPRRKVAPPTIEWQKTRPNSPQTRPKLAPGQVLSGTKLAPTRPKLAPNSPQGEF